MMVTSATSQNWKKKKAGLTMHTIKKSEKAFTGIMIILDSEI